MCHDLDLAVALLADLDRLAEVVGAPVDLDAVVQELLECGDIEDLVRCRLRGVDDELCDCVSSCSLTYSTTFRAVMLYYFVITCVLRRGIPSS